ncbi:MAG: MFS transporter [Chloroflexi bacterium]|nr:MFS transporter [Chloroflexota bacterium]
MLQNATLPPGQGVRTAAPLAVLGSEGSVTKALHTWQKRIFYGWWVVAAGFVISAVGGGARFFGFGVFFEAIVREFGWSRAATAGAFSLASLEGGLEGLIFGPLVDRHGPRRWIIIGVAMLGLGFLALSMVQSMLTFYLVYGVLMAVAANTAIGIAPTAAVANWFHRKQTLAFGILSAGFSVGGAVIVPILAWLIATFDWRTAAILTGIGLWGIGLPLALVIRNHPRELGYLPDGDPPDRDPPRPAAKGLLSPTASPVAVSGPGAPVTDFTVWEALRTRAFWLLAIAFSLRNFTLNAIVAHQVVLLVDRGFDSQSAANVLGFVAAVGIPARLVFGYLGDLVSKRALLTGAFALQAAAYFLLLTAQGPVQVYVFATFLGLAWGSIPVLFALRTEYFGRRAFAAIGGIAQTVSTVGNISGPVFAGLVFDLTGNYQIAIGTFTVMCLIAMVLVALCSRPQPAAARPSA